MLSNYLSRIEERKTMALNNARDGKLLFHLTALDNLPSIFQRGLLPRADIEEDIHFLDVTDPTIIDERDELMGLDQYVPFHFIPYTPFDYAVKGSHRNTEFVYITVKREFARETGWLILPGHPLGTDRDDIQLFSYDEGFDKVDWDAIAIYADNAEADSHVHNAKMAECLSPARVSMADFFAVYCRNDEIKQRITEMVEFAPFHIDIQPLWF